MRRHAIGLVIFALIVGGFYAILSRDPLALDSDVISDFNRHRSEYEGLVRLVSEDKFVYSVHMELVLVDVGYPTRWYSDLQSEFSTERWNEYKSIFNRLSRSRFRWVNRKDGVVIFSPYSSASRDIDGLYEYLSVSKGLAYSQVPLDTLGSLDNLGFRNQSIVYKSIGDGWYLYRDSGIGKAE